MSCFSSRFLFWLLMIVLGVAMAVSAEIRLLMERTGKPAISWADGDMELQRRSKLSVADLRDLVSRSGSGAMVQTKKNRMDIQFQFSPEDESLDRLLTYLRRSHTPLKSLIVMERNGKFFAKAEIVL